MAFWSTNGIEPLRKRSFVVDLGVSGGFSFIAKSVNKPTVETDVNEYRLINQIYKYPTVPRWNDITIKFVDTKQKMISKKLYSLFFKTVREDPIDWLADGGCPSAIDKFSSDLDAFTIRGLDKDGNTVTNWGFMSPFIKSINFGDYDYSSDDLIEVEVVIAYDYAAILPNPEPEKSTETPAAE